MRGTHTFLQILRGGHCTLTFLQGPGLYTHLHVQGSNTQQPGSWTHLVTTGPGHSVICVCHSPVHTLIVLV